MYRHLLYRRITKAEQAWRFYAVQVVINLMEQTATRHSLKRPQISDIFNNNKISLENFTNKAGNEQLGKCAHNNDNNKQFYEMPFSHVKTSNWCVFFKLQI